jgi:predicted amidohydrolase YtcJ
VAGGKILAVGSADQLDSLRSASTQVVDLAGGTLLPGLIDPHMHTAFVIFETWLDAGPMANASMDDVVSRLKAAAGHTAPGAWIKAWQYDPSITPGRITLDKASLDAIAPEAPLFLFESNGHIAHVNSRALSAAGITRDTPDPPQARYVRDANGEPTGEIQEAAAMAPFLDKIGTPGREETARGIERLFRSAARRGCTGLFDASIGASNPGDLALLQEVMARDPPIRLSGALVSTRMKAWREAGLKPGFGDDRFRVGAIKAWSDGSNQGRTGYLREPYLNSTGRGALNYSPEQLAEVVNDAHADGWQLCVHANGDAAIDVTLDAFATALKTRPRADHRHRIEHCSLLRDEQIARMKALGVSPSFLIGHVHYWGRAFRDDILGPERADLLDRCRSVLNAGLRASVHSDWNVTEIRPLRMVENAVTRIMRDGGQVLTPGERVSAEEGLRMVTADAAWQCRRDFTGVLAPGKAADLVVLDQDPTRIDPSGLRDIPVRETWLDGRRRHQA